MPEAARVLEFEMVPPADLNADPLNPRTITPEALDRLVESIRHHGFVDPVVARRRDRLVIGGHQRLQAAQRLGLARVPVVFLDDIDDERARALNIVLNNPSVAGAYDDAKLAALLQQLKSIDIAPALTGFDQDQVNEILARAAAQAAMPQCDPDDIPDPPGAATTKAGELIVLGNHRLLCGDSASPADLDRLLDGGPVHLVNTDPPYNVRVESRTNNSIASASKAGRTQSLNKLFRETAKARKEGVAGQMQKNQGLDLARHPGKAKPTHRTMRAKDRPLDNDWMTDEDFVKALDGWFGNIARVLLPGRGFYIWGGYHNCFSYGASLARQVDLYFSQAIIWVKEHPVIGRKDFLGNHEWCFYGWKKGKGHYFDPKIRNATDTWIVKKVSPQKMVHLTEKPVELAVRACTYSSKAGETVLDLFGGSGSTLIACEMTGRSARLMELDPLYCDVIVTRWEQFTGRKVTRVPAPVPAAAPEAASA